MKQKKPKIKPGRGWSVVRDGKVDNDVYNNIEMLMVSLRDDYSFFKITQVVSVPLADYRALVKNQRKPK